MVKFAAVALFAVLLAGSAHAQGPQCRTSTVGASTPSCASEAFVTKSIAGSAVTEQKNTASAGLSTSGNCDNTSTNASSPCNYARALNEATLQASPGNPTGTTSTSGVMMGLGSTCKITPVYSSRVKIEFIGTGAVTVATAAFTIQVRFGTGSAPANAAALTGTTVGNARAGWSAVANALVPFPAGGIITGLTPGTAYWFDLSLAVSTGTGTLSGLDCSAMEF